MSRRHDDRLSSRNLGRPQIKLTVVSLESVLEKNHLGPQYRELLVEVLDARVQDRLVESPVGSGRCTRLVAGLAALILGGSSLVVVGVSACMIEIILVVISTQVVMLHLKKKRRMLASVRGPGLFRSIHAKNEVFIYCNTRISQIR